MVGKGAKERGNREGEERKWKPGMKGKGSGVKRVQWVRLTVDGGGGSSADMKSAPGRSQTSVKGLYQARNACHIKGPQMSELWGSKGLRGKLTCKLSRPAKCRYDYNFKVDMTTTYSKFRTSKS